MHASSPLVLLEPNILSKIIAHGLLNVLCKLWACGSRTLNAKIALAPYAMTSLEIFRSRLQYERRSVLPSFLPQLACLSSLSLEIAPAEFRPYHAPSSEFGFVSLLPASLKSITFRFDGAFTCWVTVKPNVDKSQCKAGTGDYSEYSRRGFSEYTKQHSIFDFKRHLPQLEHIELNDSFFREGESTGQLEKPPAPPNMNNTELVRYACHFLLSNITSCLPNSLQSLCLCGFEKDSRMYSWNCGRFLRGLSSNLTSLQQLTVACFDIVWYDLLFCRKVTPVPGIKSVRKLRLLGYPIFQAPESTRFSLSCIRRIFPNLEYLHSPQVDVRLHDDKKSPTSLQYMTSMTLTAITAPLPLGNFVRCMVLPSCQKITREECLALPLSLTCLSASWNTHDAQSILKSLPSSITFLTGTFSLDFCDQVHFDEMMHGGIGDQYESGGFYEFGAVWLSPYVTRFDVQYESDHGLLVTALRSFVRPTCDQRLRNICALVKRDNVDAMDAWRNAWLASNNMTIDYDTFPSEQVWSRCRVHIGFDNLMDHAIRHKAMRILEWFYHCGYIVQSGMAAAAYDMDVKSHYDCQSPSSTGSLLTPYGLLIACCQYGNVGAANWLVHDLPFEKSAIPYETIQQMIRLCITSRQLDMFKWTVETFNVDVGRRLFDKEPSCDLVSAATFVFCFPQPEHGFLAQVVQFCSTSRNFDYSLSTLIGMALFCDLDIALTWRAISTPETRIVTNMQKMGMLPCVTGPSILDAFEEVISRHYVTQQRFSLNTILLLQALKLCDPADTFFLNRSTRTGRTLTQILFSNESMIPSHPVRTTAARRVPHAEYWCTHLLEWMVKACETVDYTTTCEKTGFKETHSWSVAAADRKMSDYHLGCNEDVLTKYLPLLLHKAKSIRMLMDDAYDKFERWLRYNICHNTSMFQPRTVLDAILSAPEMKGSPLRPYEWSTKQKSADVAPVNASSSRMQVD